MYGPGHVGREGESVLKIRVGPHPPQHRNSPESFNDHLVLDQDPRAHTEAPALPACLPPPPTITGTWLVEGLGDPPPGSRKMQGWPQLPGCRMLRNKDSAKGWIPRSRGIQGSGLGQNQPDLLGTSQRLFPNLLDKGVRVSFRLPEPRKRIDLGPGFKGTSGIQKTGPHTECALEDQRFCVPSMAGTAWHSP